MELKYFDAHTHAQFSAYDKDRSGVMERAYIAGVGMVNVGTTLETSKAGVELANKHADDHVYACVGVHPIHATESFHDEQELGSSEVSRGISKNGESLDMDTYTRLAEDPKVVAIGECGLDYFHVKDEESKTKQRNLFSEHIIFAKNSKKPLMIHCRAAYDDLISIFSENKSNLIFPAGIIHFFSGTVTHAKRLLDLGFYFTFGGVVTFTRDYDEVVQFIPIDRILSETDAPYVAPMPHRGKRNEPSFIVGIVDKLAEIRNISHENMREQILKNTVEIFKISI